MVIMWMVREGGVSLRLATELEIWIRAYAGDHVAQNAAQAAVASASSAVALCLGPICGGLSDAYGRKPMMLVAQVVSTIVSALIAYAQTWPLSRFAHSSPLVGLCAASGLRCWCCSRVSCS